MNLLILGAGGHGKCCLDIALEMDCFKNIAFLDDGNITDVCGYPVIGNITELNQYQSLYPTLCIAIGNNSIRSELFKKPNN